MVCDRFRRIDLASRYFLSNYLPRGIEFRVFLGVDYRVQVSKDRKLGARMKESGSTILHVSRLGDTC